MRLKQSKFLPAVFLFALLSIAACGGNTTEYDDYTLTEAADVYETPEDIAETPEPEEIGEESEAAQPEEAATEEPHIETAIPRSHHYYEELLARSRLWEEVAYAERNNPDRIAEMENRSIQYGDVHMDFVYFVIGTKPPEGRALYIALHGGGGVPAAVNDQQFAHMQSYYRWSVTEGIYVAVRGVRDTWDTHFNPESFPIYDRLIENMILFYGVDPNRVYLMGFSAGGDGVYAITPRMADRFAAVSMSAGHHNWVNPINFKHTPIILQCGDSDFAFYRHIETVNFGEKLRDLGYTFVLNMHVNMPHNFSDNVGAPQQVWEDPFAWRDGYESEIIEIDTNAVRFLEQHTRNPLPDNLAWYLATRAPYRAVRSFYWLRACHDLNSGTIWASFDSMTNSVNIETDRVEGAFYVLLNRQMVDFDKPVILYVNGVVTEMWVESDMDILVETTLERMDPNFQFTAVIRVEV